MNDDFLQQPSALHEADLAQLAAQTDEAFTPQSSPAAMEVKNACMYYGDKLTVDSVTMDIPRHAITALIGPSGCGKSTFLRSLNRMHEVIPGAHVSGTISMHGVDIYGPSIDPVMVRRKIGMVFQKANPFPTFSIANNVLAGIKLNSRRIPKKEAEEIVETSLRAANLWDEVKDRLDSPGSALSGGQQQRLCIARAIAMKPEVLLMDEPCSALDPMSTIAIEELMVRLAEDYTIVIVTHNMQQAARVSHKTGFFNLDGVGKPGRLVEFNDTTTLFSSPEHESTARYVSGRFG